MKHLCLFTLVLFCSLLCRAKPPVDGWHPQNQMVLVANKGQITDQYGNQRADVQYKLGSGSVNVFIGSTGLHYQWFKADKTTGKAQLQAAKPVSLYRMDVTLVGADKNAAVVEEEQQGYYESYYRPDEAIKAHSFKKITYKNVYPNIDWVVYITPASQLKYDFVVHPGGNIADIQLQYGGATKLAISNDGSLSAETPMGSITEQKPVSYTAEKKAVTSGFELSGNTLHFTTGSYTGTLIIDPALEWATYYGGVGFDLCAGLACDGAGNVYLTGSSYASGNIVTTGAYQTTQAGDFDAFLVKFNSAGTRLWGTYYGGVSLDYGNSVACDGADNPYISGFTFNSGLASTGSHQAAFGGSSDVFLVKFDTSGARKWATYYGGTADEQGGICTADRGYVYLTGFTSSSGSIATTGAFQATNGGGAYDGFLVKFDTSGVRQWGTYYGNTGDDEGEGVACDTTGNVYIGGHTNSNTGISTTGSHQPLFGGSKDDFLVKFSSTGTRLWATYYGGAADDINGTYNAVTCDRSNNVYFNGQTNSLTNISTTGGHQPIIAGGVDAFLVKFDSNGVRKWGTYYGGASADQGEAAVCDAAGNVWLCGPTGSTNNISTPGSQQSTTGGNHDAFLVKFDSAGVRKWATYFGGSDLDEAYAIAKDKNGSIYIGGGTSSASGVATPGAFLTTYAGGIAMFVAKYCTAITPSAISGNDSICAHSAQTYSVPATTGVTTYIWTLPNGWTGTSDSNSIHVTADTAGGTISVKLVKCNDTTTLVTRNIYVRPFVPAIITATGTLLGTVNTHSSYQWYLNGVAIPNATSATYTATQNGTYTVKVINSGGCTDSSVAYTVTGVSVNTITQLSNAIIIYPNPASNMVNILSPQAVNVHISSMDGKEVLKQDHATAIDISRLATGIYMLQVTDANGVLIKTEKLVKALQ